MSDLRVPQYNDAVHIEYAYDGEISTSEQNKYAEALNAIFEEFSKATQNSISPELLVSVTQLFSNRKPLNAFIPQELKILLETLQFVCKNEPDIFEKNEKIQDFALEVLWANGISLQNVAIDKLPEEIKKAVDKLLGKNARATDNLYDDSLDELTRDELIKFITDIVAMDESEMVMTGINRIAVAPPIVERTNFEKKIFSMDLADNLERAIKMPPLFDKAPLCFIKSLTYTTIIPPKEQTGWFDAEGNPQNPYAADILKDTLSPLFLSTILNIPEIRDAFADDEVKILQEARDWLYEHPDYHTAGLRAPKAPVEPFVEPVIDKTLRILANYTTNLSQIITIRNMKMMQNSLLRWLDFNYFLLSNSEYLIPAIKNTGKALPEDAQASVILANRITIYTLDALLQDANTMKAICPENAFITDPAWYTFLSTYDDVFEYEAVWKSFSPSEKATYEKYRTDAEGKGKGDFYNFIRFIRNEYFSGDFAKEGRKFTCDPFDPKPVRLFKLYLGEYLATKRKSPLIDPYRTADILSIYYAYVESSEVDKKPEHYFQYSNPDAAILTQKPLSEDQKTLIARSGLGTLVDRANLLRFGENGIMLLDIIRDDQEIATSVTRADKPLFDVSWPVLKEKLTISPNDLQNVFQNEEDFFSFYKELQDLRHAAIENPNKQRAYFAFISENKKDVYQQLYDLARTAIDVPTNKNIQKFLDSLTEYQANTDEEFLSLRQAVLTNPKNISKQKALADFLDRKIKSGNTIKSKYDAMLDILAKYLGFQTTTLEERQRLAENESGWNSAQYTSFINTVRQELAGKYTEAFVDLYITEIIEPLFVDGDNGRKRIKVNAEAIDAIELPVPDFLNNLTAMQADKGVISLEQYTTFLTEVENHLLGNITESSDAVYTRSFRDSILVELKKGFVITSKRKWITDSSALSELKDFFTNTYNISPMFFEQFKTDGSMVDDETYKNLLEQISIELFDYGFDKKGIDEILIPAIDGLMFEDELEIRCVLNAQDIDRLVANFTKPKFPDSLHALVVDTEERQKLANIRINEEQNSKAWLDNFFTKFYPAHDSADVMFALVTGKAGDDDYLWFSKVLAELQNLDVGGPAVSMENVAGQTELQIRSFYVEGQNYQQYDLQRNSWAIFGAGDFFANLWGYVLQIPNTASDFLGGTMELFETLARDCEGEYAKKVKEDDINKIIGQLKMAGVVFTPFGLPIIWKNMVAEIENKLKAGQTAAALGMIFLGLIFLRMLINFWCLLLRKGIQKGKDGFDWARSRIQPRNPNSPSGSGSGDYIIQTPYKVDVLWADNPNEALRLAEEYLRKMLPPETEFQRMKMAFIDYVLPQINPNIDQEKLRAYKNGDINVLMDDLLAMEKLADTTGYDGSSNRIKSSTLLGNLSSMFKAFKLDAKVDSETLRGRLGHWLFRQIPVIGGTKPNSAKVIGWVLHPLGNRNNVPQRYDLKISFMQDDKGSLKPEIKPFVIDDISAGFDIKAFLGGLKNTAPEVYEVLKGSKSLADVVKKLPELEKLIDKTIYEVTLETILFSPEIELARRYQAAEKTINFMQNWLTRHQEYFVVKNDILYVKAGNKEIPLSFCLVPELPQTVLDGNGAGLTLKLGQDIQTALTYMDDVLFEEGLLANDQGWLLGSSALERIFTIKIEELYTRTVEAQSRSQVIPLLESMALSFNAPNFLAKFKQQNPLAYSSDSENLDKINSLETLYKYVQDQHDSKLLALQEIKKMDEYRLAEDYYRLKTLQEHLPSNSNVFVENGIWYVVKAGEKIQVNSVEIQHTGGAQTRIDNETVAMQNGQKVEKVIVCFGQENPVTEVQPVPVDINDLQAREQGKDEKITKPSAGSGQALESTDASRASLQTNESLPLLPDIKEAFEKIGLADLYAKGEEAFRACGLTDAQKINSEYFLDRTDFQFKLRFFHELIPQITQIEQEKGGLELTSQDYAVALQRTAISIMDDIAPEADRRFIRALQEINTNNKKVTDLRLTKKGLSITYGNKHYIVTMAENRELNLPANLPRELLKIFEANPPLQIKNYLNPQNLAYQTEEIDLYTGNPTEILETIEDKLTDYWIKGSQYAQANQMAQLFTLGGKIKINGKEITIDALEQLTNKQLRERIRKIAKEFLDNPPDRSLPDLENMYRMAEFAAVMNEWNMRITYPKGNPDKFSYANDNDRLPLEKRFHIGFEPVRCNTHEEYQKLRDALEEKWKAKEITEYNYNRTNLIYELSEKLFLDKTITPSEYTKALTPRDHTKVAWKCFYMPDLQTLGVIAANEVLQIPCGEGKTTVDIFGHIIPYMFSGEIPLLNTSNPELAKALYVEIMDRQADYEELLGQKFKVILLKHNDPSFKTEMAKLLDPDNTTPAMIISDFNTTVFQNISDTRSLYTGNLVLLDPKVVRGFFDEIDNIIQHATTPYSVQLSDAAQQSPLSRLYNFIHLRIELLKDGKMGLLYEAFFKNLKDVLQHRKDIEVADGENKIIAAIKKLFVLVDSHFSLMQMVFAVEINDWAKEILADSPQQYGLYKGNGKWRIEDHAKMQEAVAQNVPNFLAKSNLIDKVLLRYNKSLPVDQQMSREEFTKWCSMQLTLTLNAHVNLEGDEAFTLANDKINIIDIVQGVLSKDSRYTTPADAPPFLGGTQAAVAAMGWDNGKGALKNPFKQFSHSLSESDSKTVREFLRSLVAAGNSPGAASGTVEWCLTLLEAMMDIDHSVNIPRVQPIGEEVQTFVFVDSKSQERSLYDMRTEENPFIWYNEYGSEHTALQERTINRMIEDFLGVVSSMSSLEDLSPELRQFLGEIQKTFCNSIEQIFKQPPADRNMAQIEDAMNALWVRFEKQFNKAEKKAKFAEIRQTVSHFVDEVTHTLIYNHNTTNSTELLRITRFYNGLIIAGLIGGRGTDWASAYNILLDKVQNKLAELAAEYAKNPNVQPRTFGAALLEIKSSYESRKDNLSKKYNSQAFRQEQKEKPELTRADFDKMRDEEKIEIETMLKTIDFMYSISAEETVIVKQGANDVRVPVLDATITRQNILDGVFTTHSNQIVFGRKSVNMAGGPSGRGLASYRQYIARINRAAQGGLRLDVTSLDSRFWQEASEHLGFNPVVPYINEPHVQGIYGRAVAKAIPDIEKRWADFRQFFKHTDESFEPDRMYVFNLEFEAQTKRLLRRIERTNGVVAGISADDLTKIKTLHESSYKFYESCVSGSDLLIALREAGVNDEETLNKCWQILNRFFEDKEQVFDATKPKYFKPEFQTYFLNKYRRPELLALGLTEAQIKAVETCWGRTISGQYHHFIMHYQAMIDRETIDHLLHPSLLERLREDSNAKLDDIARDLADPLGVENALLKIQALAVEAMEHSLASEFSINYPDLTKQILQNDCSIVELTFQHIAPFLTDEQKIQLLKRIQEEINKIFDLEVALTEIPTGADLIKLVQDNWRELNGRPVVVEGSRFRDSLIGQKNGMDLLQYGKALKKYWEALEQRLAGKTQLAEILTDCADSAQAKYNILTQLCQEFTGRLEYLLPRRMKTSEVPAQEFTGRLEYLQLKDEPDPGFYLWTYEPEAVITVRSGEYAINSRGSVNIFALHYPNGSTREFNTLEEAEAAFRDRKNAKQFVANTANMSDRIIPWLRSIEIRDLQSLTDYAGEFPVGIIINAENDMTKIVTPQKALDLSHVINPKTNLPFSLEDLEELKKQIILRQEEIPSVLFPGGTVAQARASLIVYIKAEYGSEIGKIFEKQLLRDIRDLQAIYGKQDCVWFEAFDLFIQKEANKEKWLLAHYHPNNAEPSLTDLENNKPIIYYDYRDQTYRLLTRVRRPDTERDIRAASESTVKTGTRVAEITDGSESPEVQATREWQESQAKQQTQQIQRELEPVEARRSHTTQQTEPVRVDNPHENESIITRGDITPLTDEERAAAGKTLFRSQDNRHALDFNVEEDIPAARTDNPYANTDQAGISSSSGINNELLENSRFEIEQPRIDLNPTTTYPNLYAPEARTEIPGLPIPATGTTGMLPLVPPAVSGINNNQLPPPNGQNPLSIEAPQSTQWTNANPVTQYGQITPYKYQQYSSDVTRIRLAPETVNTMNAMDYLFKNEPSFKAYFNSNFRFWLKSAENLKYAFETLSEEELRSQEKIFDEHTKQAKQIIDTWLRANGLGSVGTYINETANHVGGNAIMSFIFAFIQGVASGDLSFNSFAEHFIDTFDRISYISSATVLPEVVKQGIVSRSAGTALQIRPADPRVGNAQTMLNQIATPTTSRVGAAASRIGAFMGAAPFLFTAGALEGVAAAMDNEEYNRLADSHDPYEQEKFYAALWIMCVAKGAVVTTYAVPDIILSFFFPNSRGLLMSIFKTGASIGTIMVVDKIAMNVAEDIIKDAWDEIDKRKSKNEKAGIPPPPQLSNARVYTLMSRLTRFRSGVTHVQQAAGDVATTIGLTYLPLRVLASAGAISPSNSLLVKAPSVIKIAVAAELALNGLRIVVDDVVNPDPRALPLAATLSTARPAAFLLDINPRNGVPPATFEMAQMLATIGAFDEIKEEVFASIKEWHWNEMVDFLGEDGASLWRNTTNADNRRRFDELWSQLMAAFRVNDIDQAKQWLNRLPVLRILKWLSGSVTTGFGHGDGRIAEAGDALLNITNFLEIINTKALVVAENRYRSTLAGTVEYMTEQVNDSGKPYLSALDSGIQTYLQTNLKTAANLTLKPLFRNSRIPDFVQIDADGRCTGVNLPKVRGKNFWGREAEISQTLENSVLEGGYFYDNPRQFVDFMQYWILEENDEKVPPGFNVHPYMQQLWKNLQTEVRVELEKYSRPLSEDDVKKLAEFFKGKCVQLQQHINLEQGLKTYFNYRISQQPEFKNTANRLESIKDAKGGWRPCETDRDLWQNFSTEALLALRMLAEAEETIRMVSNWRYSGTAAEKAKAARIYALYERWRPLRQDQKENLAAYLEGKIGFTNELRTRAITEADIRSGRIYLGNNFYEELETDFNLHSMAVKSVVSASNAGQNVAAYFQNFISKGGTQQFSWEDANTQEAWSKFLWLNEFTGNSVLRKDRAIYIPHQMFVASRPGNINQGGMLGSLRYFFNGDSFYPPDYMPVNEKQDPVAYGEWRRTVGNNPEARREWEIRYALAKCNSSGKFATTEDLFKHHIFDSGTVLSSQVMFGFGDFAADFIRDYGLESSDGTQPTDHDKDGYTTAYDYNYAQYLIVRNKMLTEGLINNSASISDVLCMLQEYKNFKRQNNASLLSKLGYNDNNRFSNSLNLIQAINNACGKQLVDMALLNVILSIIKEVYDDANIVDKRAGILDKLLINVLNHWDSQGNLIETIFCLVDILEGKTPTAVNNNLRFDIPKHNISSNAEKLSMFLRLSGILSRGETLEQLTDTKLNRLSEAGLDNLLKIYRLNPSISFYAEIEKMVLGSPLLVRKIFSSKNQSYKFRLQECIDSRLGADFEQYSKVLERTANALSNLAPAAAQMLRERLAVHRAGNGGIIRYRTSVGGFKPQNDTVLSTSKTAVIYNEDGLPLKIGTENIEIPAGAQITVLSDIMWTFSGGESKGAGPWYCVSYKYNLYGKDIIAEGFILFDVLQPQTEIYIVRGGDTLSGIAAKYGITLEELYRLNPEVAPNRFEAISLNIGRSLKVPIKKKDALSSLDPAAAQMPQQSQVGTYVVLYGDTLYDIARQYKITLGELYRLNPEIDPKNGFDPQKLNVGRILKVPK